MADAISRPPAFDLETQNQLRSSTRAWLDNLGSDATRTAYERALADFARTTGKHYNATQDDVIHYRNILAGRSLAQATINLKLSALSSLFAFLLERGLVAENPVDGVKRRNVNPYGKATVLKGDDAHVLLTSIDRNEQSGKRDYAMIRLFLSTALRLSELAQLRRGDVRRHGTRVYAYFTGKGGAAERVVVGKRTLDALEVYLRARGPLSEDAPLFASCSNRSAGKSLTERGIQSIILRRCDAAFGAGHGITPHSLRHTAAVQASETSTVAAVSKLLRHKNMRVTTIYLDHIDTSAVDDAYEALDSAF